jgi:hypothetical protein
MAHVQKLKAYLLLLNSKVEHKAWPLVQWLRANPLGPALTVCLAGLASLIALPQLTMWLIIAPKLVLTEVILLAPFVPYAVYRVHQIEWRRLAALWAAIYIVSFIRTPHPLKVMSALGLSAHITSWFLWGFVLTAVYAWYVVAQRRPPPKRPDSIYDKMSSQAG